MVLRINIILLIYGYQHYVSGIENQHHGIGKRITGKWYICIYMTRCSVYRIASPCTRRAKGVKKN